MDFLEFSAIHFENEFDMGLLSTSLTDIIGACTCFDSFTVQNKNWLSLVKNIFVAMNSDQVLFGVLDYIGTMSLVYLNM
jgi:hypothetical protein